MKDLNLRVDVRHTHENDRHFYLRFDTTLGVFSQENDHIFVTIGGFCRENDRIFVTIGNFSP